TVEVQGQDGRVAGRDETDRPLTDHDPRAAESRKLFHGGEWRDAPVFRREALKPGHKIAGPALIIESHQTIVVEPGWGADITAKDHVLLSRTSRKQRQAALGTEADPVMLEVFNNLFMSIRSEE